MKSLTTYLKECEGGAMPSNTLGAGNPGLVGPSTLSEPLTQGEINRQPTAKTKAEDPETSKTKKKKRKDLREMLEEELS